jgi:hypothetical protein
MRMSDSERRSWTELETELATERRLVSLSRRVGVMPSPALYLGWAIGAIAGLALVLPGIVVHSAAMLTAGAVVLVATAELAGIALVATGVSDAIRHSRRPQNYGRRRDWR